MASSHGEGGRTVASRVRAMHLLGPLAMLKVFDGLGQLASALLLVLVPGGVLTGAANTFATRDLIFDPDGRFAEAISSAAARMDGGGQPWLVVAVLATAAIKLAAAALVLTQTRVGIPAAVAVFGVLCVAEAVCAGLTASVPVLLITLADAAVVLVFGTQLAGRRVHPGAAFRSVGRFSPHS